MDREQQEMDRGTSKEYYAEFKRNRTAVVEAVKKYAGNELGIEVRGQWLIDLGISEAWAQMRAIERWGDVPGQIDNGNILPGFRDYITLDQAKLLGLLDRLVVDGLLDFD